jgi:hypothetical protein
MLVFRSCSCSIPAYNRVPHLASVYRERTFAFEYRRSHKTNKYQSAQQAQHENNRLERNENHHSNLRGEQSSLQLPTILLPKTQAEWVGTIIPPGIGEPTNRQLNPVVRITRRQSGSLESIGALGSSSESNGNFSTTENVAMVSS